MSTATDPEANGTAETQAKPPFLRRVRIRGYKSIAFCDVTLEPLTILVGRNASGKSNFLDSLAFLRDVLRLGANEATKLHGGADSTLSRTNSGRNIVFEIECGYPDSESDSVADVVYLLDIHFPTKQRIHIDAESLQIEIGDERMGYSHDGSKVTCFASGDGSIEWAWGSGEYPFLVRYYNEIGLGRVLDLLDGVRSFSVCNFQPERIRQLHAPAPGVPLEHDGSNLASVIETTRENDQEAITRVGRYLSAITGSVEQLEVVRYGDYETVRLRVTRGSESPLEFDAASMSDGTLRTLAALVAAFQVMPPHGYPRLVAIEEPETSLHPAAMRALVDALDEATLRTQILLTTHSADMLDNPTIKPENIRVVQMIDGKTVIAPVDEASVEIVRKKLNTLGGLERENQLEPDLDDVERQQRLAEAREGAAP
jgi:predicted ATPase